MFIFDRILDYPSLHGSIDQMSGLPRRNRPRTQSSEKGGCLIGVIVGAFASLFGNCGRR